MSGPHLFPGPPPNTRRRSGAKLALIIILAVAVPLLLVGLVCGGLVLLWLSKASPSAPVPGSFFNLPQPGQPANAATYAQLRLYMTRAEVEAVLGPGRAISEAELPSAPGRLTAQVMLPALGRRHGVRAWSQWEGGDEAIVVGFTPDGAAERATVIAHVRFTGPMGQRQATSIESQSGALPGGSRARAS
jgi:hypothetical protein